MSTAIRPIRCFLCIMYMQWSSKGGGGGGGIKYMYCFLLHIFISFSPRTTHQTSQSQAMQVWTHLRPRSPLHTSLALHAILLIIDIVYGVCRIVIKSIQQCTYFLFFVNLLLVGVNYVQSRVWRYQRGNQNPYIEEQTTQWPKEKGQTTIYKIYP
jgi:hypothetical protein